MKKLIWFAAICLLAGAVSGQAQNQSYSEIAGAYVSSSGFTGHRIAVNADGSYEKRYFTDCCEIYPTAKGTFSFKQNIIRFVENPNTKKDKGYGDFEMNLVRWGDRLYLVDNKDLRKLVVTVIFGIEPRASTIFRNYMSQGLFLRQGDEQKKVHGSPTLPGNLDELISAPAIELKLVNVSLRNERQVVIADTETLSNVKIGMGFVEKGKEPDLNFLFWVVSVGDKTIELESEPIYKAPYLKVGATLTNRRSSTSSDLHEMFHLPSGYAWLRRSASYN